MKRFIEDYCPPALKRQLWKVKLAWMQSRYHSQPSSQIEQQDLDIYWTPAMSNALEQWGAGSVWDEIQFLLINCQGKVLDIACGPGGTMRLLEKYPALELHGIDISDLLINQAIKRGLPADRLRVGDATKMPYADGSFDYGYSIGSLEHFTELGISAMLHESRRIAVKATFHMIPIARDGKDQGWLKTIQSFHNNSEAWWLDKFHGAYQDVTVLSSRWEDEISVGKWFVCRN